MKIVILWPIQRFQTFLCLPLRNLVSHGITVNTSQNPQSLYEKPNLFKGKVARSLSIYERMSNGGKSTSLF